MNIAVNGRNVAICDGCGQEIPPYPGVPAGYVSPDSQEFKDIAVNGVAGKENVAKIVCLKCFRIDFTKVYPTQECPI